MRSSELFNTLQNLINRKPTQKQIADILGVRQSVIGNRATRDSEYTLDELIKIESFYAIDLNTGVFTNNNDVELNYYPNVYASCGDGLEVLSEASEKIKISKQSISNYSAHNTYSVVNCKGNSMYPLLNDGDKAIIKHWNGEQILDDRIYLFKYDNQVFIKQLYNNIDQLIIKSNNPEYPNRILEDEKLKKVIILGQVVGLIRQFD